MSKRKSKKDSNYIPNSLLPLLKHTLPEAHIRHIIGIDPGALTGYAIYSVKLKEWRVETYNPRSIWTALTKDATPQTFFVVEYNKGFANAYGQNTKGGPRQAAKSGFNVGLMAGLGVSIAGYILSKVGPANLKLIDPFDHKQSSWDAAQAKAATSFQGSTNEHNRDAMRMALWAIQPGYQDKAFYKRDKPKIMKLHQNWLEPGDKTATVYKNR